MLQPRKITIDFETRSRRNLKTAGAWKYAMDPSTTILSLAYLLPHQKDVLLWTPDMPFPEDLAREMRRPGTIIEAHNANFEIAIWTQVGTPKFHFPKLNLSNVYCSAAKAAACSLPRDLDGACEAMMLPEKKDKAGHRVMLKLTKPRKPTKHNLAEWHDSPEDFAKLYSYNRQDVRAEHALSATLPELSEEERELFLLDHRINKRGVHFDRASVEAALKIIQEGAARLGNEIRELTMCEEFPEGVSATQVAKLGEWCALQGEPIESLSAENVAAKIKEVENPLVKRVLQIRLQLSKSSNKKLHAMLARACDDDRMRDLLMFLGANTGRWAGRGVQPQNFPRGKWKGAVKDDNPYRLMVQCIRDMHDLNYDAFDLLYSDPFTAISNCLRGFICAEDGNILRAADYSAIEARVVLWLAGDEAALNIFRRGEDIYKAMASEIYGVPVDEVTDAMRQVGKQAVLGLGYQMGAQKFKDTCAKFGIEIDMDFAKRVVKTYRTKFKKVADLWYECERAAIRAVTTRQPQKAAGGKLVYSLTRDGKFLTCTLASGRKLYYPFPRVVMKEKFGQEKPTLTYMYEHEKTGKWVRRDSYGGLLVENADQATSRDIMANAMLRCDRKGYHMILTVHDEIISETSRDFGSFDEFKKLVATLPHWAKGLPLEASGWEGERYRK